MINSDYDDVNTLSLIYKKPKNNIQNKSEKLLIVYFYLMCQRINNKCKNMKIIEIKTLNNMINYYSLHNSSNSTINKYFPLILDFKNMPGGVEEIYLENIKFEYKNKNMFNNLPNTLKIIKIKAMIDKFGNEYTITKELIKYGPRSLQLFKLKGKYSKTDGYGCHSFRTIRGSYNNGNVKIDKYDMYSEIMIKQIRHLEKENLYINLLKKK